MKTLIIHPKDKTTKFLFNILGIRKASSNDLVINDYCIHCYEEDLFIEFIERLEELSLIIPGTMKPTMINGMVYIPRYNMVNTHLYVEMWCSETIENNKISISEFLKLFPIKKP